MLFERPEIGDRAIILQIELKRDTNPEVDEFAELAKSASIDVVEAIVAPRDAPHPHTFIGKGKVQEVKALVRQTQAGLVLVNHELKAGQQRNLEKI